MDPVKQKFDEAYALLTRAGAPYELVTETVDGQPLRAFRNSPRNMRELFAPAYQHGDKEFVVFEGERWSFARLLRLADSIAHQLVHRSGVRKGDRVAIAMRNYPEWMAAYIGITSAGATVVPLNSWGRAEELEFALTVAGLTVLCPATAVDAKGLLKSALRGANPVIFCENKFLYRRVKATMPGGEHLTPIGKAHVMRAGTDLTFVAYGASTWIAMEAAEVLAGEGVECEVVDLRSLVPYDEETVLASVQKTNRAVVVHEAQLTGGFGGEIAARLADRAFAFLDAPVKRVAYPDRPSPYSRILEHALFPDRDKLLAAAREVLAF